MPSRFGLGSMTNASARFEALLRVIARLCCMKPIAVAFQVVGSAVRRSESGAGHLSAPKWDSVETWNSGGGGGDADAFAVRSLSRLPPAPRWRRSYDVNDGNGRTNAASVCERTRPTTRGQS